MPSDLRAALGWTAVQFVQRPDSDPPSGFAVEDEIEGLSAEELRHVRRELRALQAAGIPPDTNLGQPDIERIPHRCKGDTHKTDFYVLKCKPGDWRLYFIADDRRKRLIFLYAVQKRQNKRDPEDLKKCERRLAKLRALTDADVQCLGRFSDILVT